MTLEYMWPGLWIVSLVPLLAFVTTLDGLTCSSLHIGHGLRMKAEWVLILTLLSILSSLVVLLDLGLNDLNFDIYGTLGRHSHLDPRIWLDRHVLENWLLLIDVLLILFSLPVVIWMALRRRRPLHLWLLIGLLGTYGAIVWLAVNGPTTARRPAEKTS
jgi:hypothetical protein